MPRKIAPKQQRQMRVKLGWWRDTHAGRNSLYKGTRTEAIARAPFAKSSANTKPKAKTKKR